VDWKDRIIVDPKVLVGKPVIRGTRIAVEFVVDLLGSSFHEKLYNRGSGHTTPVAPAAPLRHRAFLASAPAAGAPPDAR
jgi:Protein of unknown function (DUF433)